METESRGWAGWCLLEPRFLIANSDGGSHGTNIIFIFEVER